MKSKSRPGHRPTGQRQNPRNGLRGFTLIELILGIGLLMLIAGGTYRIVLSVAEASSEIQRQQARREAVAALIDTLRSILRRMPSDASVELAPRSAAPQSPVDLIFRDDPLHPFSGQPPPDGASIILRLEPQGQGLFHLCRFIGLPSPPGVFDPPVDPDTRLVLLRDIRSMTWENFDSNSGKWVSEFPRDGSRPRLLRLDLLPAEEAAPTRVVFALAPKGSRSPGITSPAEGGGPPSNPQNPPSPPDSRPPVNIPVPSPTPP